MKEKFDWKSFLKALAVIAIPVALQNLLTTTGSMIDTMMVSSLGELQVGALGMCAQFSSLMFSCYWGFSGGGALFFSQYWGAKDHKGIERSFGMVLVCMGVVALIFCGASTCTPQLIMKVYTDKVAIQQVGVEYLRIVGFAYPLQILSVALGTLLRSTERVKISLVSSIISVATNIVFNYLLIFGKFGFPQMGIRGAAAATVIAGLVNVGVTYLFCLVNKYNFVFHFRNHFRWDKLHTKEFFVKCAPVIANELGIGIGNMIINIVLGRQSEQFIAALAVFRTFEGLVISFFVGFSGAAAVLVGKPVGSGHLHEAFARAKRMVYICMGCTFTVCVSIFAMHTPLLHLMSLEGESFKICTMLILIYCVAATIRMSNWCQNDIYRSGGDAAFGSIIETAAMFIMLVPLVCLTGLVWKAPYYIVFMMCFVDEPIRFIIMQKHMYSGKWIKPVTPQGKEALREFGIRGSE
ncbi:MAG: MATE family efflux transporter [Clostridia bacterium]|nr:MATE family efflux transporter [Clostridia bacterium]